MDEAFMGLPTFIWDNIFTIINTLVCGLIVAIFTSTFLKKKEERTRIAGVILEKRINSEQEILSYLEKELFKEEINIENSGKYDVEIIELLMEFNLPVPYGRNLQYAVVFKSMEKYGKFFYGFEEEIQKRKLWLDKAVREHLIFMQMYFANFNVIPLMVKKIPLPKGQELTDEQFANISDKLLLLLGAVCDAEINALVSKLEELIVNSVYKLDLRRPKNSILRNMMVNSDTKKIIKRMENRTILGLYRENIFQLIMQLVYTEKGIDIDSLENDEFDDFMKSSDPQTYNEIKDEFEQFKAMLEKIAEQEGVRIIRKDELDEYPGEYAVSLGDIVSKKKVDIKTTDELAKERNKKHKAKTKK